ncbi:hypothetical protein [Vandammella animalimorsus]|uniref:hypothetical protein n=1 Tax=Vandammella animalimorsus TaxID=2029117 RepID=UPI0011776249|nr:hypothetical protein [Vandammella animalimorsus]
MHGKMCFRAISTEVLINTFQEQPKLVAKMKVIYFLVLHSALLTGLALLAFEMPEQARHPRELFVLFLIIASGSLLYPLMGSGSEIFFSLTILLIIYLARNKIMKNNVALFFSTFFWCLLGFMLPVAGSM